MSNRHLARSIVMQILYQWDFRGKPTAALPAIIEQSVADFGNGLDDNVDYIKASVDTIIEKLPEIDEIIVKYATNWPIAQMTLIDRNILRIGVFEMKFNDSIPAKVAINEAIELGKNYGGPTSGKFVNGILGALYTSLPKEEPKEKE